MAAGGSGLMLVRIKASALRDTHWHEYALRFGLGGLATVCTGLVAEVFGPATGGLFLAFPAVFCASATLIEKHERNRKQKAGLPGTRRGRQAAALDALGAAIGSFGLLGFAAVMWTLPGRMGPSPAFIAASLVWMLVSVCLWWGWRRLGRLPD
jgi:Protein of unknown function (DUF3147)